MVESEALRILGLQSEPSYFWCVSQLGRLNNNAPKEVIAALKFFEDNHRITNDELRIKELDNIATLPYLCVEEIFKCLEEDNWVLGGNRYAFINHSGDLKYIRNKYKGKLKNAYMLHLALLTADMSTHSLYVTDFESRIDFSVRDMIPVYFIETYTTVNLWYLVNDNVGLFEKKKGIKDVRSILRSKTFDLRYKIFDNDFEKYCGVIQNLRTPLVFERKIPVKNKTDYFDVVKRLLIRFNISDPT